MPRVVEGHLSAEGLEFTVVVGRFNDFITARLLDGALDALRRHGANDDQVTVYWVPGAFEIPLLTKKLVDCGKVGDAVICLGTLIRGATPHFDYIAAEATKGIAAAALMGGVPVSFGVLTTETIEQAIERAGTKSGNKGWEAAVAAIEMANLYKRLEK
ncbi:MAG: 6,7-dimethyl-8-ribityllumazine synthase [bacterium]|nr:6,7-dimethyl-8-ribityllumazine synthase [bacterium]